MSAGHSTGLPAKTRPELHTAKVAAMKVAVPSPMLIWRMRRIVDGEQEQEAAAEHEDHGAPGQPAARRDGGVHSASMIAPCSAVTAQVPSKQLREIEGHF